MQGQRRVQFALVHPPPPPLKDLGRENRSFKPKYPMAQNDRNQEVYSIHATKKLGREITFLDQLPAPLAFSYQVGTYCSKADNPRST